jgi:hypothetical protein
VSSVGVKLEVLGGIDGGTVCAVAFTLNTVKQANASGDKHLFDSWHVASYFDACKEVNDFGLGMCSFENPKVVSQV